MMSPEIGSAKRVVFCAGALRGLLKQLRGDGSSIRWTPKS
jgi:hypothetical protein